MSHLLRKGALYFSAGALGGLANAIAVWFGGSKGITAAFGVMISPPLTPAMLYHRIAWGGIWGLIFFLPLTVKSTILKALLYSLGPTFVQLFIIFPERAHKGMMGLQLGTLTPLLVVIFNLIWALTALLFLKASGES